MATERIGIGLFGSNRRFIWTASEDKRCHRCGRTIPAGEHYGVGGVGMGSPRIVCHTCIPFRRTHLRMPDGRYIPELDENDDTIPEW